MASSWVVTIYIIFQMIFCGAVRIICIAPVLRRKVILPYYGLILLGGMLFGALSLFTPLFFEAVKQVRPSVGLLVKLALMPVFVMKLMYSFDWLYFYKAFKQVCVMGIVVFFFKALSLGSFFMLLNGYSEPTITTVAMGAMLIPTEIDDCLDEHSQLKTIRVIFKGEVLISMMFSVFFHDVLEKQADTDPIDHLNEGIAFGIALIIAMASGFTITWLHRRDLLSVHMYILNLSILGYFAYIVPQDLSYFGIVPLTVFSLIISPAGNHVQEELAVPMTIFLETLDIIIKTIITWDSGVLFAQHWILYSSKGELFFKILAIYCFLYIFRFSLLFYVYPVLRDIGLSLDIPRVVLIGWCGLGHIVTLSFLYTTDRHYPPEFNLFSVGIVLLSQTINVTTLKYLMSILGLMLPPKSSQMEECSKNLILVKQNAITLLKIHKLFGDAHFGKVELLTAMPNITDGSHGLKKDMDDDRKGNEMEDEARLLILKALKMSFDRQRNNGFLEPKAYHTLRTEVDAAFLEDRSTLDLTYLRKYWRLRVTEKFWLRFYAKSVYHNWSDNLLNETLTIFKWECCIQTLILACTLAAVYIIINHKSYESPVIIENTYTTVHLIIIVILLIIETVEGRWEGSLYVWTIIDILGIIFCITFFVTTALTTLGKYEIILFSTQQIVTLRLLRFRYIITGIKPSTFTIIYGGIGRRLVLGYGIGTAYIIGLDDAAKVLPLFVQNKDIVQRMTDELETGRQEVMEEIQLIQRDFPILIAQLKTTQCAQNVLKEMGTQVMALHYSGMLDEDEYKELLNMIEDTVRKIPRELRIKPQNPLRALIRRQNWLADDYEVIETIMESAAQISYKKGMHIFKKGSEPRGIYFVHFGLIRGTYEPDPTTMKDLTQFGILPNVDHPASIKYQEAQVDMRWDGTVFGEIGFLTGRTNLVTLRCETPTMVSLVERNDLLYFSDKLQPKIWKNIAVKIATLVLAQFDPQANFEISSNVAHRSIFLDLSKCKKLVFNNYAEIIVLIEGLVCITKQKPLVSGPALIQNKITEVIIKDDSIPRLQAGPSVKMLIVPYINRVNVKLQIADNGEGQLIEVIHKVGRYSMAAFMQRLSRRSSASSKIYTS